MRAKVSSSASQLLHMRLLVSPIKWRCLLRLLCPVRRPITTLDCVLLKDKILVFVAKLGPKINSWACLTTLPNLTIHNEMHQVIFHYLQSIMLCPFLTNISTCKPQKTKASPAETIARYPLGSQRIQHTLKRLLQKENKNKT